MSGDAKRHSGAVRRLSSIRVRLLALMVVVVLLVAAAVGAGSGILGLSNARQQVFRQLESVTTLKARQVDAWLEDLQLDLEAFFTEEYETTRMRTVLLWLELMNPRDAQTTLRLGLQRQIARAQRFDEVFLVNMDGEVVLSTSPEREGVNEGTRAFFERGLEGPYVHPPAYDWLADDTALFFARPAIDAYENTLGVLVARSGTDRLEEIMGERSGLGQTGETYLIGALRRPITELRYSLEGEYMESELAQVATSERTQGRDRYESYHDAPVLGAYRWVPALEVALLAEQQVSEVTSGAQVTIMINAGVALGSVVAAVFVSVLVARGISNPLAELSRTATQIAAGNLSLEAEPGRRDEIGVLARSFNSMTAQLRELIGSLEGRVAEATRNLEAAAEVSRATTSVLDPETLQRQVVDMIRERFDLYYVGLFLLDQAGKQAVLRAGTGQFGRTMLAQGHQLKVGADSMIGQCVARNEQVVLQTAGDEVARFDNPLLPDTRSELALPMRARGRVIGAVTVQSDRESAFDEQYISALQTVADQVAVALSNARLFQQAQESAEAERRAYGELTQEAWRSLLRAQRDVGYVSDASRTAPVGDLWEPQMEAALQTGQTVLGEEGAATLSIPIRVRGQVIGIVDGLKPDGTAWMPEEVDLLEAMSEQLNVALEGAQLYGDAQRREARERTVGQVTSRIRQSLELEDMLRTAAIEIRQAMGLDKIVVRLAAPRVDDESSS